MRRLLLGVAATALMTSGALAADLNVVVPTTINSATFDWDGFYAGLGFSGTAWVPASPSYGYIDLIAGVNMTSGNLLFGLEGWISGYGDGTVTGFSGGAEVRAGYLVSPEALIYLSAGGTAFDLGGRYGQIGAGVEFAVTDSVSLDIEYKYGAWSNTAFNSHTIGASANFHF